MRRKYFITVLRLPYNLILKCHLNVIERKKIYVKPFCRAPFGPTTNRGQTGTRRRQLRRRARLSSPARDAAAASSFFFNARLAPPAISLHRPSSLRQGSPLGGTYLLLLPR
jgi:hypothetical protein